jgi:beta-lactamase regulating signal transducer with metallopeptidase domain
MFYSRLFSILFWFNPVIWLYQKAILKIWIHRGEALLKISDKKAYQITLLKITAHENCVALSNHFINH